MNISDVRKRANAFAEGDLRRELEMSIKIGCGIRKRFKLMLWKIITGEDWVDDRSSSSFRMGGIKRCGSCMHFKEDIKKAKGSYGCSIGENWARCNKWLAVELPLRIVK